MRGPGHLASLKLSQTGVTDVGLDLLAGLGGLGELELGGTGVSEAWIAELRRLRPDLKVTR